MENCADCGNPYPFLQRAHVVARHKGGPNAPENIVRLCPNCHFLRDRADRVAWAKKRWENIPPEERSAIIRRQMAALSVEQREARARKISASKGGKKMKSGHHAGGARVLTPEQLEKRAAAVRASYAAWTPERRAEHSRRIREGKQQAKEVV